MLRRHPRDANANRRDRFGREIRLRQRLGDGGVNAVAGGGLPDAAGVSGTVLTLDERAHRVVAERHPQVTPTAI